MLQAHQRYAVSELSTASPERLVVAAYERMVKLLYSAEAAMRARDFNNQNISIQKVQDILDVLSASLNAEAHPELCRSLVSLYEWFHLRLAEANVKESPDMVADVREQLSGMRDAWHQANLSLLKERPMAVAAGVSDAA